MKAIADEVTESIAHEAGVPVGSVTRETRIWHDLHLCGDDAVWKCLLDTKTSLVLTSVVCAGPAWPL